MSDVFDEFETAEIDGDLSLPPPDSPWDEGVPTGPRSARDLIKHRMIKKQVDGSAAWKDGWASGYLEGMSQGKKDGFKQGYEKAKRDFLAGEQLPE